MVIADTLVNGQETDRIDINDRGLQYGDGLFETIVVRHGELPYWALHMQRLSAGCRRLGITPPDLGQLEFEAAHLARGQQQCIIKIIVTRGSGGRGYTPPTDATPTRIVRRHPWPAVPERWATEGLSAAFCETRLGRNPQLAGIKHLNRLEQVVASRELQSLQADEGLVRDIEDYVVEGTRSNLFVVHNGQVLTADLANCGIAGVMRSLVLAACDRLRLPTLVQPLTGDDLASADEIFVTNSLMGVCPITRLNFRNLPAGPVTADVRSAIPASAGDVTWRP